MANPRSVALGVLHYLAPVIPATYWITARIVAAFHVQKKSKRAESNVHRHVTIYLQLAAVTTIAAAGFTTIDQAIRSPTWSADQDLVIYLILSFAFHACLALNLIEVSAPVWHPVFGAYFFSFAFEIALTAVKASTDYPETGYSKTRFGCGILRTILFAILSLLTATCTLRDRRRSVRLDAESEALLASSSSIDSNGTANGGPSKPANGFHYDAQDSSDGTDEDDWDQDAESSDREDDKQLKADAKKRLAESGDWLTYLKDFQIFVPMLFPWQDRAVQACLVAIGLAIVVERALNVLVPRQLGIVVDELTAGVETGTLPWRAIGLWILYSALHSDIGVNLIKLLAQLRIRQYGYKALRAHSFRHIMSLGVPFHNSKNSGELIRTMEQGTALQDMLDFICFDVAPTFCDLVTAFIYLYFLFDIYVALIPFAVGVIYIWIGTKVTVWSIKRRRAHNAAERNESKVQNEAINNWHTVSHFNRAKYESERYSETVSASALASWRYYVMLYVGGGFESTLLVIGRLGAAILAARRVSQGQVPVGSFVTLISYWSSVESPLMELSWSVRKISGMLTDSERLLQLFLTKPTVQDAPGAIALDVKQGECEFTQVAFAYDSRKPILNDVSFRAKAGQTVALVGETGGGKSTILKLLYRDYDVNSGSICIDGQDIRGVTVDSLRDSFGLVPQDPTLFNVSIMENLKYARLDATDEEVYEACRAAAIHDKIETFPDGYNSMVGERGVKLSGGELQRVSIARAILRRSKIVILDEATSMIDADTETIIQEAFKRLAQDRTIFVIAHRLSTIQHADLILVVHGGEIVERGTHDELFRQKGRYVALWSKQISKEVRDVAQMVDDSENGTH